MVINVHFIKEDHFPRNRGKLSHHIELHEK